MILKNSIILAQNADLNLMKNKLLTGQWLLKDLNDGKIGFDKNGLRVFSCFHCAGGSTMGYKLAGFDVLGGVEIDPEIMAIYRANHKPKHSFLMSVKDFKKIPDNELPSELFDLDILDGSPPCSSFSMAGSREDKWGVSKKFREGQADQVLDDLFFDFIDIANKLKPKIIVAENVKGMLAGNARGYVKKIFHELNSIGYETQLFLLNASKMGVPQKRERVFFISRRKDLKISELKLDFDEKEIAVVDAFSGIETKGKDKSKSINLKYYLQCKPGESFSKYHPNKMLFHSYRLAKYGPANTLPATCNCIYHYESMRNLSRHEYFALQSFPQDFEVQSDQMAGYICGMSVPPYMMQRIADQIYKQFFLKNK